MQELVGVGFKASTEDHQVNAYRWVFSFPILKQIGLAFKC